MNVNQLFNIYLKDLNRRGVKTAGRIEQFYENDIMSVLGDKEVTDIIRGDIASLLFDITDRSPYTSNKCLSILKAMFNLAITLSYIDINPCNNIPRNREIKRKRYLTNDELLSISRELDYLSDRPRYRKACNFIRLLIMTGARVGEIRNARWSDINNNMLVIKEHKSDRLGEDRIIHITPGVQKILDACVRDSEFIIGIVSPRSVWKIISERAGCADARLHDIRHSYASWSLQKVNLSDVGNLLGHRDIATTQRYAHIHKDQAIKNAKVVSNHLESILKNNPL